MIKYLRMPRGLFEFCVLFVICFDTVDTGISQNRDLVDDEVPLKCYFCHGMGPNNDCEKFGPYKDAVDAANDGDDHEGPVTLKTCTPPFDKSCMIETFRNNNGGIAHIRDCSDDKTFDFTEIMTNISSYSRLLSLHDNNKTACANDTQRMVCLSKCGKGENYTDLCNGPQFDSALPSSFSKLLLLTVVFFYVMLFP